MAAGGQQGMQTFDQALLKLWKSGTISEVEALRNADSANNLRLQMKMDKIEATDGAMESMLSKDPDDDEGGFKLSI